MAVGLYIHTPFCAGKCPYCDFYSLSGSQEQYDAYTAAVALELERFGGAAVDTVYFGGGTPPLLGSERLARLLCCVRKNYTLTPDAEITVEMNPGDASPELLCALRKAGFNRLSMGVQSGIDSELRSLGRRHTAEQAAEAVAMARKAGFDNISLDLMLAVPGQTQESLMQSIDFLSSLSPEHISAYILKIEEGTPFAAAADSLELCDDDTQAELYLAAVGRLAEKGYGQYEISNFCRPGFESRHNLKYWHCEEYIGIGPSAHGFIGGRRYYYPRDLAAFLSNPQRVDDGEGGTPEEYIMLALRLTEGLTNEGYRRRFGCDIPPLVYSRTRMFAGVPLLCSDESGIRLTPEGFLVSNAIIAALTS